MRPADTHRAILSSSDERHPRRGRAARPAHAPRGGRRDAHPRADRAQSAARPVPRGRQRQPAAEGPLARRAGQRRAARHERPLVGAPADRAQPRAAPVPAAAPARAEVVDRDRLRARPQGRRGDDRRRLPAARPRHVDPPHRPRGVQPLPRRRPARRPAREGLRGARADRDRLRDPARDHRPSQGRAAADLEAGVVRVADALDMEHGRSRVSFETSLREHPLALGGRDRRGPDRPGRAARGPRRGADEQLGGRLPGRRAAGDQAARLGLEEHIEVVARIDAEHEKRLLRVYQI